MRTIMTNWKVDVPTIKGRLYSRRLMHDAIITFIEGVGNKGGYITSPGQFIDPKTADLSKMTHVVKAMRIEEDGVISADIVFLRSDVGQAFQMLFDFAPELFVLNIMMNGNLEYDMANAITRITNLDILGVNVAAYTDSPLN